VSGFSSDGPGRDGLDAATLRRATPADLWQWTEETSRRLADGYGRVLGAGTAEACRAHAPALLRLARRLLTLRLTVVAAERRQAFEQRVPRGDGVTVAALWAEVFWAARAAAPDDDSGVLERADAAVRALLAATPADLAAPAAVTAWWERLQEVEETLGGLQVQAQVALEARLDLHEHDLELRRLS
jgi:hypothetical protein